MAKSNTEELNTPELRSAKTKTRLPLLDQLRGLALLDMVLYHFLYDYFCVWGHNPDWFRHSYINYWQETGLALFIVVSGMTYALMKDGRRWQQVLRLQALGLAVTAATVLFMPSEAVYYGVLTFFGSIMLLTLLLENQRWQLLSRLSPRVGLALSLLGYALTVDVEQGYCSIGGVQLFSWPQWLYCDALTLLGFSSPYFSSADYVPLLPYGFLFWAGIYLRPILLQHCPHVFAWGSWGWVQLLGRHSLLVYVLHQPVLLGLMEAVAALVKF